MRVEEYNRFTNSVGMNLCDGVIDIESRNLEQSLSQHAMKVVNTGCGLLGKSLESWEIFGVLFMDNIGQVSTVVEDHVQRLPVRES